MAESNFLKRYNSLKGIIGKAGMSALFADDFEYYAITLELTDSNDKTVEWLTFPVNPSSIQYSKTMVTTIKQTMGGVTAIDSEAFTPSSVMLNGTFGRSPKTLIISNSFDIINSTEESFKKALPFSATIKTGYGTLKIMERIIEKSILLDENNKPHRLYLYNPTLNHSFLVKPTQYSFSQDQTASNMMWNYNVNLTTIASTEDFRTSNTDGNQLARATQFSVLNRAAQKISNTIKNLTF